MSQQMNLMAYVTLYNQQYSNVALYESFLRTAQTREAIVQNAQDKGYVPSSESAAKDTVDDYKDNPSQLSGSYHHVHQNSPALSHEDLKERIGYKK